MTTTTTTTPAAIAISSAAVASLPAQLVAAVAVAASRDESKQILQCVHVRNDGAFLALAATDGHRLITVRIPQNEHCYISTSEILLSAEAIRKPGKAAQTIEIKDDGSFSGRDAMGRPISAGVWRHHYGAGTFPNYDQLIPDHFSNCPKAAVTVNASYLADWAKVVIAVTPAKDGRGCKAAPITSWETNGPINPIVWSCKVDPRLIPGCCDDDVVMRHLLVPVQVRR